MSSAGPAQAGITGRIAAIFASSKLTPIAIALSIALGLFAVLLLPREEEPGPPAARPYRGTARIQAHPGISPEAGRIRPWPASPQTVADIAPFGVVPAHAGRSRGR